METIKQTRTADKDGTQDLEDFGGFLGDFSTFSITIEKVGSIFYHYCISRKFNSVIHLGVKIELVCLRNVWSTEFKYIGQTKELME